MPNTCMNVQLLVIVHITLFANMCAGYVFVPHWYQKNNNTFSKYICNVLVNRYSNILVNHLPCFGFFRVHTYNTLQWKLEPKLVFSLSDLVPFLGSYNVHTYICTQLPYLELATYRRSLFFSRQLALRRAAYGAICCTRVPQIISRPIVLQIL